MQLGIFAKTFPVPTLAQNLDAVVAHKLSVIQFNFACAGLPSMPDHVPPETARQIGDEIKTRDLTIAAVSGTCNLIHPDPQKRADGIRRLAVIAGSCASLGTSLITLCTGTRDPEDMWRRHPENDSPEAWRDLLTSLSAVIEIAEKFNLKLGIEPETANVISSARKARHLLSEMKSSRLKIVIDPANLFRPGELAWQREVIDDAFDLLGDSIVLAHAKDVREENGVLKHIAAGKGVINFGHYLSALDDLSIPLILHGLEPSEVDESVAFLRDQSDQTSHLTAAELGFVTQDFRRKMKRMRAGFLDRGDAQIFYRQAGYGVPFFFQHGLGGDINQPLGLFDPPEGFRLIAFDCRFHGQTQSSDANKISLGVFADDLLALMDHLNIKRAIVGGISMGAAVALNFALRFPERVLGLVLQRPAWLAEPNQRNAGIFGFVAKLIREHDPKTGVAELKRSKLYADILAESPDCANSLVTQFAGPRAKEAISPLERIPLDAPNHDRGEWKHINVPTLVLANRQDPIHPFEFGEIYAREIPGAEFHELTCKSVSVERYGQDTQRFIEEFLLKHFGSSEAQKK
jgi:pimeloyl-ACP methyl ester carboxylesterase/sugar phosphate isomerase/epimerase